MAGPLFDVFLQGALDASPSVQMRLAVTIAERYRLSAPVVAEALAGGSCRVAERLSPQESESLVKALGALGAIACANPAAAPVQGKAKAPPVRPPPLPEDRSPSDSRKDGRVTLKSGDAQVPPPVLQIGEANDLSEQPPTASVEARGADSVRCPIHGLSYNRRQASGCLRCLAPARAEAQKWREGSTATGSRFSERDGAGPTAGNSVRRAFRGLAVAIVLGFLPAVYYARAVSGAQVADLRARQADLSRMPASRDVLARFDEIDAATHAAYLRGAGGTLLIWVVTTVLAGAVWIRVTRTARESPP